MALLEDIKLGISELKSSLGRVHSSVDSIETKLGSFSDKTTSNGTGPVGR